MVNRREFVISSIAKLILAGFPSNNYTALFAQANEGGFSEEIQYGDPALPAEILKYAAMAIRRSIARSTKALGIRKNPKTFGLRMAEIAKTYIGISSVSEPEQVTDFLSLFSIDPRNEDGSLKPYCAAGVSFCACQAYCDISPRAISYSTNRVNIFKNILADINDYYFEPHCACQRIVENAKSRGIWQSGKSHPKPERGWLVFFDWTNSGKANHVGIVESFDSDRMQTIEFNTSSNSTGDQRNGGVVACKCRDSRYVLGFVRTYQSD